jgi:hypothetical protein
MTEIENENENEIEAVQKKTKYGSRHQVFDLETAVMTRGGLKKEDLMLSKSGKIVSRKKSEAAKISYAEFGFAKRAKPAPKAKKPKKTRKRKNKE